jgi:hypothetical protein
MHCTAKGREGNLMSIQKSSLLNKEETDPDDMMAQHLAQGRKQVFETDRARWRREILYKVDPTQVLFVQPT